MIAKPGLDDQAESRGLAGDRGRRRGPTGERVERGNGLDRRQLWGMGGILDWFHARGVIRAHQGLVLSPSYLEGISQG